MASDEAKRLRAEVQKRIKSVNAKIARTQKNTGAKLSGTEFDPRRRAGIEKNYNAKQLSVYLSKLNDFMRRTNQFVSGNRGAPLPRGQFNAYKKLEQEYGAAGAAHEATVGNIQLPEAYGDLTIRQHKAITPESQGSAVYGPYRQYNREAKDIKNVGALQKLSQNLKNMLRSSYLQGQISAGREQLEKALSIMGENEMINQVNGLSDYQFDVLWFGTEFAENVFDRYDLLKEREDGTAKERYQDSAHESQLDDLGGLLDFASGLPRERPKA